MAPVARSRARPAVGFAFVGAAAAAANLERSASFKAALDDPFAGYCGHAPGAQEQNLPRPFPKEALDDLGIELIGVQVAFRHAARDLSDDEVCFNPVQERFRGCHVKPQVSFAWPGASEGEPPPVEKVVHDPYPMVRGLPGGMPPFFAGCGMGVLLDEAVRQTRAFAGVLQDRYFARLPAWPNLTNTWLYSTDMERTMGTLFLVRHFLFGGDSAQPAVRADSAPINTRPYVSDRWALHEWCPRVVVRGAMAPEDLTSATAVRERFPAFADRWRPVAGTDFAPWFFDCLLVAMCSGQEGIKLPQGLQPGSELFNETLRVSLSMFQERYAEDRDGVRLLASPSLIDMDDMLKRQVAGNGPPLALWSTHDTTLLAMLVALGAWDGQWPIYTDTLVVEAYRSRHSSVAFFRLLHKGVPVRLPHCPPPEGMPEGFCEAGSFLPPTVSAMRDPAAWRAQCNRAPMDFAAEAPAVAEVAVEQATRSAMAETGSSASLNVVGALSLGIGAFAAGLALGRRQPAGPPGPLGKALLGLA